MACYVGRLAFQVSFLFGRVSHYDPACILDEAPMAQKGSGCFPQKILADSNYGPQKAVHDLNFDANYDQLDLWIVWPSLSFEVAARQEPKPGEAQNEPFPRPHSTYETRT